MTFNLRLSHKINSIAALGIAGLLVLGGVYFAGNASQDAARGRDDNARSLRELQGKVFDTILKLRRAEKDFLLRKEEKYVQLHHKLSEEVKVDLAEMQHQAAAFGHADLRDELSAIQSGYTSYLQHFARLSDARIRLGLKEDAGLEGSLRTSVHQIETTLKPLDIPELTTTMLMMRRHEKDFMLRGDARYGDDMKHRAGEISLGLPRPS